MHKIRQAGRQFFGNKRVLKEVQITSFSKGKATFKFVFKKTNSMNRPQCTTPYRARERRSGLERTVNFVLWWYKHECSLPQGTVHTCRYVWQLVKTHLVGLRHGIYILK